MYTNIFFRKICNPSKFFSDLQASLRCCFKPLTEDMLVDLYQARLEFWEKSYPEQAEDILSKFRLYWVKNTDTLQLLSSGWISCPSCFQNTLGISSKRFRRIRSAWEESGRQIVRMETLHNRRLRAAPIKNYFFDYLRILESVSLCYFLLKCISTKFLRRTILTSSRSIRN